MYIYIYIHLFIYIGSLILEVFDFWGDESVPAPIPTLFLPQEWPKIPSCAEFRKHGGLGHDGSCVRQTWDEWGMVIHPTMGILMMNDGYDIP